MDTLEKQNLPALSIQPKESPKSVWQRAKARIFTKDNFNKGAVIATVATTGSLANADYVVTDVLTNIGLAVTAAATIGVAWLGFTAGIAIWRNLRAAAK